MSYTSNYNLNQRISYLESIISSIVPYLPINLANTLLGGNSAGTSDINLNFNDIQNVNSIVVTDGVTTNTINEIGYTTRNSVQNITHYLNFSDSAATGTGAIQKNASLNCNPFTGTLTATNLNGNINVIDTNASGTFYPVFVSAIGNQELRIDSATGPLTYNPLSGSLSPLILVCGNIQSNALSSAGTMVTNQLSLTTASSSFRTWTLTMSANINSIVLSATVRQTGNYKLIITGHASISYTILAGGSGGLGTNHYTNYSTTQTIAPNSRWVMYIDYDGTSYYYNLIGPYTG